LPNRIILTLGSNRQPPSDVGEIPRGLESEVAEVGVG